MPSTLTADGYGDLGFAVNSTPRKPVFVFMMNNVNKISLIIAGSDKAKAYKGNYERPILTEQEGLKHFNLTNAQSGKQGVSLIQFYQTNKNYFNSLIK